MQSHFLMFFFPVCFSVYCWSSFVTGLVQQRLQTYHQRASSDGEGPPLEAASCRDSQQGCQLVSIVAVVLWYGHLSIGNQLETAKLIWEKPMNRHWLKTVSSYTPAIWTGLIRACARLWKQKAMHCWQWWSTVFRPGKHIYCHVGNNWCSGDGVGGPWRSMVVSRWGTTDVPIAESLTYLQLALHFTIQISHRALSFNLDLQWKAANPTSPLSLGQLAGFKMTRWDT